MVESYEKKSVSLQEIKKKNVKVAHSKKMNRFCFDNKNNNGCTTGQQYLLNELNKYIITKNNSTNLQNQDVFVK